MKLPSSLYFLRPGWWGVHIVAIALVGGAGFAIGLHHAGEHAGHDEHAAHADPESDHAGHHDHGGAAVAPTPAAPGETLNAVQSEMRLLERALASAPASFAAADLKPLVHQLHAVHMAKEKTEEAIHHGSYRLPKKADDLAGFVALDQAFHGKLEKLVEHASKNELEPAAAAYGEVLGACNGCHSQYR